MKRKYTDGNTTPSLTNDDDGGVHDAAATAEKARPSIIPKRYKNHIAPVIILPQAPQKTLGSTRTNKIQQTYKIQCWAHTKSGIRCSSMVSSREGEPVPIPYCDVHLKSGDGALKVVRHPIAGKCLVARYDLPAKYRIAFWGKRGKCQTCDKEDRAISYYPPDKVTGRNRNVDGTNKVNNYNGVLNPGGTGDLIQYAACPGPNERQNMRSTFQYFGIRNGSIGGLEFITLEQIPKNTQLCHWYGSGWWNDRGIKRIDVGTRKYPAPLRENKTFKCLTES